MPILNMNSSRFPPPEDAQRQLADGELSEECIDRLKAETYPGECGACSTADRFRLVVDPDADPDDDPQIECSECGWWVGMEDAD